nr:M14 family metallopeptidase [Parashewanella curva]
MTFSAHADTQFVNDNILPPLLEWQGQSTTLMQDAEQPWSTPFEHSNGMKSPSYDDTFKWLDKLVAESSLLHKVSLGKSPQGRDIWMIIATKEGLTTSQALAAQGKPTLLVQAGIHAGEIDGKDAGMMLLRDMVKGEKAHLLDNVNLLFIPIFSVDAHERSSTYNRVNQRGPVDMGWRTNARNLNLNRDYAKADTIEMRHMLNAINQWQPDLYIDVHVTDGIDYQYDITYGYNLPRGLSKASYQWLDSIYRPTVDAALENAGHIPGPLVFAMDKTDLSKGLHKWVASQRYSDGYGHARHLPTILVENHSLKPFKQRVLGTYVYLEQTLKTLAQQGTKLKTAIAKDKFAYPDTLTLTWKSEVQPKGWNFKGVEYFKETSSISGSDVVRWTGKPKLYPNLPVIGNTIPDIQISRPSAYFIPPQWQQVIKRLQIHGIRMTRLAKPQTLHLRQYQFDAHKFANQSYEGHQRVNVSASLHKVTSTLPAGTVKITTKQPLGDLAIMLLEPQSPDSFLQWGFFNPIFTRTEYMEAYAVEPMAAQMLKTNPELKAEFDQALKDKTFAADPKARLRWFYERSPYYDNQYLKYPVYRQH